MLLATLDTLRQRGYNRLGLLGYDPEDRYSDAPDLQHYQLKDFFSHGHHEGLMRFILHAQDYSHFCLIGADVMDGYYSPQETLAKIEITRLAAQCGLTTTVLGFSFNANADKSCVDALRSLPGPVRLYARDPVSQRRLEKQLGRNIQICADLAFLLDPDKSGPEIMPFAGRLETLRQAGRTIIGINAAYLVLGPSPTQFEVDALVGQIRNLIAGLATQYPATTFVLVPHDSRGSSSDVKLAEKLFNDLSCVLDEDQLVCVNKPLNSREIKALCSLLDAAFTCRMHFGIACLSQGIPIAAIGYQGKFEGLMEHLGLDGLLLPDAASLNPDILPTLLRRLIDNREYFKAIVREKIPAIRRLAAENFSQYRLRGTTGK